MRLLFLSSSLEPGQDGVGDYLRLLAEACARLGHSCAMLALRDSFVAEPTASILKTPRGPMPVMRLPAAMSWTQRVRLARDFREAFRPDWISFHLVPYAFERRGLLFGLVGPFRMLMGGTPLHLMFHELWIGIGRSSPLRPRITGRLQRLGIRRMLSALRPRWVTTSNPVYAAMLRTLDVEAEVVPLFGNVPLAETGLPSGLAELPEASGITAHNRKEWWIGIFFGSLHGEWRPEPFLGQLLRAAQRAGKRVCLLSVGRLGSSGEAIWTSLEREYASRIVFVNRGEQPAEVISALLQAADFGIAASPWQLIGKSGTAAAMLDHGLPVVVTRDDFEPAIRAAEAPSDDPLIHLCRPELEAKLTAGLPRRTPRARVDAVAAQLCDRLQSLTSSAS